MDSRGGKGSWILLLSLLQVAALCLTSLAQRRALFEDVVADEDEVWAKRAAALSEHDLYRDILPLLSPFQIYVLDKLEALFQPAQVLDTHMFADTPEIEAFLQRFDLTLLRVRPPSEWNMPGRDIGHLQGSSVEGGYRPVLDIEDLEALLRYGDLDLKVVHYQYPGYEHFDVVSSVHCDERMTLSKSNEIRGAVDNCSLIAALRAGERKDYRRLCLHALEIQTGDLQISKETSGVGRHYIVFTRCVL